MRNKVELLAPAGSPEGIRAAVQSGAGAVYMGFGMFNARRNAQGFSHDEMADAIAYCRARDVKTNITLNILAGDRELEDALEDAKFLYEAGADALIVQDLGLARLIHAHAPDFALHASTQMTIHTLDAAKQARDIGFSRVVLSRECSREEIKLITEQAGVETEVFVHGALCMCYSGQCEMSAVIGGRSGNRGACAQPCRLPYGVNEKAAGDHPLSLKDANLADYVQELEQMGVACLKLEGRMKRPEYVAVITGIYRRLLDEKRGPSREESRQLEAAFSRSGFTDGYYKGRTGPEMFGTRPENAPEPKELFAQAIHNASSRRRGPFIAVNCGALPKSLIEAELFGYEGGSFTGARRDGCAGKFELANGGTIFLDEIGDMPVDVQITLLRVLQNRAVRRIGASKALRIDVRVITATNRDLEQLVDSKVFREDLFYRINVFRINIPSLRERTGDVRQLAGFFLAKYSDIRPGGRVEGFTAEALAMMEAYPWPGNVRQLENSVERAVYLAEGELVTAAELPPEVRAFQGSAPSPAVPAAEGESPSGGEGEDEAARIQDMLHRTHGNVMEAARLLGISRRTLYRKLQRYHIDYSSHRI